jgi:hypothetical protein
MKWKCRTFLTESTEEQTNSVKNEQIITNKQIWFGLFMRPIQMRHAALFVLFTAFMVFGGDTYERIRSRSRSPVERSRARPRSRSPESQAAEHCAGCSSSECTGIEQPIQPKRTKPKPHKPSSAENRSKITYDEVCGSDCICGKTCCQRECLSFFHTTNCFMLANL